MNNNAKEYYDNIKTIASIIATNGKNQISYDMLDVLGVDVLNDKRYRDFFELHGYEIVYDNSKFKMNDVEERELIILAQNGNEKALNRLLRIYEQFIGYTTYSFTNKYQIYNTEDIEDCKQEARLALIKAIKSYNVNRISRLFKYAYAIIYNALEEWKSNRDVIKIPARTYRQRFVVIANANNLILTEYNRNATDEEIAELTGFSLNLVKTIRSKMGINSAVLVEHQFLSDTNDNNFISSDVEKEVIEKTLVHEAIDKVFKDDELSKKIFWMYYGLGYPKKKIMQKLNLHDKQRLDKILKKGLTQMKLLLTS